MKRFAAVAATLAVFAGCGGSSAEREPGPIASGSFTRLMKVATGEAKLVQLQGGKRELRLLNFQMPPAPDLFVYLIENGKDGQAPEAGVKIGPLRSTSGDSTYGVPESFDDAGRPTVLIWCEACKGAFAYARLEPV